MPQGQPFDNTGYGLIGAFAIVYIGWAVSILTFFFDIKLKLKLDRSPLGNTPGVSDVSVRRYGGV